jgi:uncharacterized membrane protein
METVRKIGILMMAVAVVVAGFGLWLKIYNDKLAMNQLTETGSCYLPDGTCLHATSDTILYASVGIAVLLAFTGFYLFIRKEPKVTKKKERRITKPAAIKEAPKTLTPENRSVYNIVLNSNGAILQGELVTKSGMDKVKISRILDKLEMLGLVERRRHGMSNLVVLKKK